MITEEKTSSNFKTATNAGLKGIKATGRFMNKALDFADKIDKYFYLHGGKLKWFIGLSLTVVVGAPLVDWIFNIRNDRLTAWSTFILLIFLLIMFLAWIGSLRDDEGNWSLKRVFSRLWTYLQINIDFFRDSFSKPLEEMLYRISVVFIIGSFCWKALQNVSVFIRKPYESFFHTRWDTLRSFEKITNQWAIWIFILGITILVYLYIKNKEILNNLVNDYLPFLSSKKKNKKIFDKVQITTNDLVFNAKDKEQIKNILNTKNPELFNNFVKALQTWSPRDCNDEDDFQNSFHRHLKRNIPHVSVEREFRIPVDTDSRKDKKADVVIDETILVEMKKDHQSASTSYVYDQMWNYTTLWKDKGPVILLFCEADYEQAKNMYSEKLQDLIKLEKKVIAFVARPK